MEFIYPVHYQQLFPVNADVVTQACYLSVSTSPAHQNLFCLIGI
ncbi:hypothetical protein OQX63_23115 [Pedobacter sp. PF22-3]|nr:hypothetical protein [Pedobacter sp. PF22-3]